MSRDYPRPKLWDGQDLDGSWLVSIKIDGARMLRDEEGNPISRAGKPLYNLDHIDKFIIDAEIFSKDWETSMSLVRSSVNGQPVDPSCVYSLWPALDSRLFLGIYENPAADLLIQLMESAIGDGYEGLVVRQGTKYLKIKPKDTADVMVTGIQLGTGKYEGLMGALITNHGKVGTGFTDEQRRDSWKVSEIIEVEYMEVTKNLKMRHPRFIRKRVDKNNESLPWSEELILG